jgi:hypothetical protein
MEIHLKKMLKSLPTCEKVQQFLPPYEKVQRFLQTAQKVFSGILVLLLLVNMMVAALLLTGIAHFAEKKNQSILRNIRDDGLKFLVNFFIGVNSLIDGHHNPIFQESSSKPKPADKTEDLLATSAPSKWDDFLEKHSSHNESNNKDTHKMENFRHQSFGDSFSFKPWCLELVPLDPKEFSCI